MCDDCRENTLNKYQTNISKSRIKFKILKNKLV